LQYSKDIQKFNIFNILANGEAREGYPTSYTFLESSFHGQHLPRR